MNEIKEMFYRTDLFLEIEKVCDCVLSELHLSNEQRVAVESLIGNAADKAYEEGMRTGMAEIINQDLWW